MSTSLRDLLKDKTLPVRIVHETWVNDGYAEVHYQCGPSFYGHYDGGSPWLAPVEATGWSIIEPKRPRLLAWRRIDNWLNERNVMIGTLWMLPQDDRPLPNACWERVPHLDEPAGDA